MSRIGAAEDEDPFAEAMGEAFSQAADVQKAKSEIQHNQGDVTSRAGVNGDDDDDELADIADNPEDDDKQRRLAQTLATGDAIEEVSATVIRVDQVEILNDVLPFTHL